MNRRSLLSFLGLAPLAAILPGLAKADTVTSSVAGSVRIWPTLDHTAAAPLRYFTERFPQGAPPFVGKYFDPDMGGEDWLGNPAYALRAYRAANGLMPLGEDDLDDMAAYCDELVPIAEPEDEMLGG